jgi:hypothetical protein
MDLRSGTDKYALITEKKTSLKHTEYLVPATKRMKNHNLCGIPENGTGTVLYPLKTHPAGRSYPHKPVHTPDGINRTAVLSQRCHLLALIPCTGTVIKKTMYEVFSALIRWIIRIPRDCRYKDPKTIMAHPDPLVIYETRQEKLVK